MFIPANHLELLSRGFSEAVIDPQKSTLFYFFPFLSAFFSNYQELKSDPGMEAMMPQEQTARILEEITDLTHCAGIKREIVPYAALNHEFSSCGGPCSFTKPALFLPVQHLFRRNGNSPFTQERPGENLAEKRWIFSDDETRFLIARQLGQIKENSILVRVAIKVAVLAAVFIFYTTPYGWAAAALCIGALGLYILTERRFQARADLLGARTLQKKIPNAVQIAIRTLEKIRLQNLFLREHSRIAKWYITPQGNNFFQPFLTTRIERLRSIL